MLSLPTLNHFPLIHCAGQPLDNRANEKYRWDCGLRMREVAAITSPCPRGYIYY